MVSVERDVWVPSEALKILVVDDSRLQRRILAKSLAKSGILVREAGSGEEALELCSEEVPDIILSDWMMPGISGLELCKEMRRISPDRYVYFIMLTSKSEKGELEIALREGADDFLAKPISSEELRGRISAGARILGMERELTEKNRLVTSTLDEMNALNEALDRDLVEARKLQMALVPRGPTEFVGGQASFWLQPSGHVGGDLVGIFASEPDRVGIFALDVSGHGIASALITARISSWLSGDSPDQNVALEWRDGQVSIRPPDAICERLNHLFNSEIDTEHYFTILVAEICLRTGALDMCQAGHPHPVVQRADGTTEHIGAGGLPIGLIADADFETVSDLLQPGDRLFIYSDGLSECPVSEGDMLDEEGVASLLTKHAGLKGEALLEAMRQELNTLVADRDLPDDVSAVVLEFNGAP